jgi:hypothetical protein
MPGSARVSREMPVRIGLLASRQNDLRKSAIAKTRSPTRETRALPQAELVAFGILSCCRRERRGFTSVN